MVFLCCCFGKIAEASYVACDEGTGCYSPKYCCTDDAHDTYRCCYDYPTSAPKASSSGSAGGTVGGVAGAIVFLIFLCVLGACCRRRYRLRAVVVRETAASPSITVISNTQQMASMPQPMPYVPYPGQPAPYAGQPAPYPGQPVPYPGQHAQYPGQPGGYPPQYTPA
ncbi:hypothetical protein DPMN_147027 [Dreissena polymorpha]|uniref:Uncharacterized protein n=2 Tax=Dreissena polymorpha TaxID=45954 RepID=A0A9D4F9R6_DREPO|nr:hypothetical protein DPMN_147027 [Dreissena polymorpha]